MYIIIGILRIETYPIGYVVCNAMWEKCVKLWEKAKGE